MAPNATLINVKVLDDNGGMQRNHGNLVRALIDIIAEHKKNKSLYGSKPLSKQFRGSIINMSFRWVGFDAGGILDQIIAANEAGISVFVAAGNDNEDASDVYPCANPSARCIAAVDNTYHKMKSSNYGRSIQFVAPGYKVRM